MLLNRAYKLCLIDYYLQQELCYLEKLLIRYNNFLKWVVILITQNVHNEQANPSTTVRLSTEVPSKTKLSFTKKHLQKSLAKKLWAKICLHRNETIISVSN